MARYAGCRSVLDRIGGCSHQRATGAARRLPKYRESRWPQPFPDSGPSAHSWKCVPSASASMKDSTQRATPPPQLCVTWRVGAPAPGPAAGAAAKRSRAAASAGSSGTAWRNQSSRRSVRPPQGGGLRCSCGSRSARSNRPRRGSCRNRLSATRMRPPAARRRSGALAAVVSARASTSTAAADSSAAWPGQAGHSCTSPGPRRAARPSVSAGCNMSAGMSAGRSGGMSDGASGGARPDQGLNSAAALLSTVSTSGDAAPACSVSSRLCSAADTRGDGVSPVASTSSGRPGSRCRRSSRIAPSEGARAFAMPPAAMPAAVPVGASVSGEAGGVVIKGAGGGVRVRHETLTLWSNGRVMSPG